MSTKRLLSVAILVLLASGPFLIFGRAQAQVTLTNAVAVDASQLALGQRIYREGIGAAGQPLRARGAAQASLDGKSIACAGCHRRSGYGTTEGQFVIRPIIGPALLQSQSVPVHAPRVKARVGVSQRPPYDAALLARAIRGGISAAGQALSPVMPRYEMSDDEMKALTAYLFSLSAQPSPGVDEREIHFATVIQPGVAPERRRAMLEVMAAFFKDKTANMRSDEQRREAGTMRMYRSYRKWVLHVWELAGPGETWGAQLQAHYDRQPVFALVGGIGSASWGPVHAFSERLEIPSVFPQVELPVLEGPNHYTFYLSRGVVLEAQVLAKFLRDADAARRVVQVYRRDETGLAAANAFRAALADGPTLDDRILEGPADEAFWRELYRSGADALVLWSDPHELDSGASQVDPALQGNLNPRGRRAGLAWPWGRSAGGGHPAPALYLASAPWQGRLARAAIKDGVDVRLVYPSDLPSTREARLLRGRLWLHNKGITLTDEAVQVNTQFTLTVVSDALGHMMDSFSRDLFVERVEHAVGQTPMPSFYQSVSLGPGQRFAAKGSAVVQVVDGAKGQVKPLSGWIVP